MHNIYDAMIIGGGASGLIAACALARRGRRVVLLEQQDRVGRKLLSTGNGRCNLTNLKAGAENYHGDRQAVRMALRTWPPKKVMAFFETLGIPCVADEAGRVYPMSRQAASVLDALRLGCDEAGVETRTGFRVTALNPGEGGFEAVSEGGERVYARCALVCTGGLAAPKLGACGDGYRLLERLGHTIVPCFPAIAALITPPEPVRGLKGIRAEAEIALLCGGEAVRSERGEVLFAESGVSGIAAMQLARAGQRGAVCREALRRAAGFCAGYGRAGAAAQAGGGPAEARPRGLPERHRAQAAGPDPGEGRGAAPECGGGELTGGQIDALAGALSGWTLPVTGTQGFDQAQVTAGGASLKDFDIRCMGSLRGKGCSPPARCWTWTATAAASTCNGPGAAR